MTASLKERLLASGACPLLIDEGGASRSGAELLERVERLAGALASEDLAGKRVGVWYENCFAAFEAYLAIEWIGATRIVLDPRAPSAEAASVLEAAAAEAVVADAAHAARTSGVVLCHDDEAPLEGARCQPVEHVPRQRPLHLYPRAMRGGELLAVPISYGNWAATIELGCRLYRSGRYGPWSEASEVFLTVQQLLHGTGLLGTFPFLHMGRPQVFVRRFAPDRAPKLIERHQVTSTGMTSGMLAVLLNAVPAHGLPSLRRLVYGGASPELDQLRHALDLLGPVLVQIYGRLEGGWPLTILDQQDHAAIATGDRRRGRSCGVPVGPDVELSVGPNGELRTRSPMAVAEYCDADGWCRLGDFARIDPDGYVFLEGRLDTMVNTDYHVYPEEVEEALTELPGVAAARVVGQPRKRRRPALAAYVVAEAGTRPDPEVLRDLLRDRLAPHKVPRVIKIVDALDTADNPTRSEVPT